MTGLHEVFGAWIDAGARDPLPRDVALHASACPDCLQRVAAHDALTGVDLGAASAPPLVPGRTGIRSAAWLPVARLAAGFAAVAFIGVAGYVAVGGLLGGRPVPPLADLDASPRGGVLSGAEASPQVTASAASDAPSDSASARPSDDASAPPTPPMGGGPPPPITPGPVTPPPTYRSTPTPGVLPTATAAPPPTPKPATPSPTPTPTPTATSTPASTGPPPTEPPPSETPPA